MIRYIFTFASKLFNVDWQRGQKVCETFKRLQVCATASARIASLRSFSHNIVFVCRSPLESWICLTKLNINDKIWVTESISWVCCASGNVFFFLSSITISTAFQTGGKIFPHPCDKSTLYCLLVEKSTRLVSAKNCETISTFPPLTSNGRRISWYVL